MPSRTREMLSFALADYAGFCMDAGMMVSLTVLGVGLTNGVCPPALCAGNGLARWSARAVTLGSVAGMFFNDAVSRRRAF